MTEGMFCAEEKLEVVSSGVADLGGFANHAKDIRLIQERRVHSGTYLMRKLVLKQKSKRLPESVVKY